MQGNVTESAFRGAIKRIIDILEYVFLFVMIAECNSMYASTQLTDMRTAMSSLFYTVTMVLAAALLVLYLVLDAQSFRRLKRFMPFWLLLMGCVVAFYALNVRGVSANRQQNYFRNFVFLLPLMMLLFKLKQQRGETLDLLFKHADVVCVIAAVSLVVYLASVFHVDSMPSDPLYSKWSGYGVIRPHINLLNVTQLMSTQKWQISNVQLLRNYGFFVEPLMFIIPLITALHTELFLRKRSDLGHLYRAVLLSVVVLTANSTIGMMLMAFAWAMKVLSEGVNKKKLILALPVVAIAVGACVFLVVSKRNVRYEATEVSGSSIADHIEDIRAGIKAFLHRPLLGGGYQYEAYIRQFMDPAKVARNPGLSNSIATMLAEGGLVLGALCLAPFAVCFLYAFRDRQRDMAFWAVGPIGLLIGVIFVYHPFLMLLIAFGYSLVDVERVEGKRIPWRLRLVELQLDDGTGMAPQADLDRRRTRTLALASACVLIGALLMLSGLLLFRAIHFFLREHQFGMEQSPIKAFCFTVVVLIHCVCLRNLARRETSWGRVLALLVWDAVYLIVYPRLFSDVSTVLVAHNSTGGRLECMALMGLWSVGCLIALEAPVSKKWLGIRGAVAVCAVILAAAGVFFALRTFVNRIPTPDAAFTAALEQLTDAASGKVYASEQASLYRRINDRVAWSTTAISGFENYENASIVYRKGSDRWELFEHGFEVAQLTDDYLVYTNDKSVIEALTGQGCEFYRYYPYEKPVDLGILAFENELETTDEGVLLFGGNANSLESGPSDTLLKGRYTARYSLHVAPELLAGAADDTKICSLVVSYWNGKFDLAFADVTAKQFDDAGDADIDVVFTMNGFGDGVDYKALGEADYPVELRALCIRQTPLYITAYGYNCYRNPIREVYYNADGTPFVRKEGHAALEREYNLGGMIGATRYYDADMQPVLIKDGYAEIRFGYNDKRTRNYEAYFGTDGRPITLREGYAARGFEHDAYGNMVSVRYFDGNGRPVLLPEGYAEIRRRFNAKKQPVYEAYYDVDGARAVRAGGYSARETEFNEDGSVLLRRYLDVADAPVMIAEGYAEIHYGYDAIGRINREEYFDGAGQRTLDKSGVAVLEKAYNDSGNIVREAYFGTDEKPKANANGYAEVRRTFDAKGRIVGTYYFGTDGAPVASVNGYYGTQRQYDSRGNIARIDYLGPDGEAMLTKNGYASLVREYDGNRNIIVEKYLGEDGAPLEKSNGVAEVRKAYDDENRLTSERYYDAQGMRTLCTSGYGGMDQEYDDRGDNITTTYVGLDDQPKENNSGVAIIRREYDGARNCVAEYYFDAQGNPTENKSGVAVIRREYDENRNKVSEEKTDLSGNVI